MLGELIRNSPVPDDCSHEGMGSIFIFGDIMQLVREINEDYKVSQASACMKYLNEFKHEDREFFITLGLDTNSKLLFREVVAIGSLNACLTTPREIFKNAITHSANTIIIAHNHPSGNTEPSPADRKLYKELCKAGEIIGIKVLDSIVFSYTGFHSILEE